MKYRVAKSFRDLEVYNIAFAAAMRIFEMTKSFPLEEKYSLTDQIRRSSRSVCATISEAWRKRRYPSMFISKLADAEQEAAETQQWLEFAHYCGYIGKKVFQDLDGQYERIYAMLFTMQRVPNTFCKEKDTSSHVPGSSSHVQRPTSYIPLR